MVEEKKFLHMVDFCDQPLRLGMVHKIMGLTFCCYHFPYRIDDLFRYDLLSQSAKREIS